MNVLVESELSAWISKLIANFSFKNAYQNVETLSKSYWPKFIGST